MALDHHPVEPHKTCPVVSLWIQLVVQFPENLANEPESELSHTRRAVQFFLQQVACHQCGALHGLERNVPGKTVTNHHVRMIEEQSIRFDEAHIFEIRITRQGLRCLLQNFGTFAPFGTNIQEHDPGSPFSPEAACQEGPHLRELQQLFRVGVYVGAKIEHPEVAGHTFDLLENRWSFYTGDHV